MSRKITLSPFFDDNVLLVAGICTKCYRATPDLQITAVNTAFLHQAARNKTLKWVAPRSPHGLIEESLPNNPWALLVATIFLSKTPGVAAKPIIARFLQDHPHPRSVLQKRPRDLEVYFDELGLRKRARLLWGMTHDFLHKEWRSAGELFGIGRYGEDAFRIFCLGDFSVEPQDRYLRRYWRWYKMVEEENGD